MVSSQGQIQGKRDKKDYNIEMHGINSICHSRYSLNNFKLSVTSIPSCFHSAYMPLHTWCSGKVQDS